MLSPPHWIKSNGSSGNAVRNGSAFIQAADNLIFSFVAMKVVAAHFFCRTLFRGCSSPLLWGALLVLHACSALRRAILYLIAIYIIFNSSICWKTRLAKRTLSPGLSCPIYLLRFSIMCLRHKEATHSIPRAKLSFIAKTFVFVVHSIIFPYYFCLMVKEKFHLHSLGSK